MDEVGRADCREAIYSNEWFDLMLRMDDEVSSYQTDACLQKLDGDYQMWYVARKGLPELNFGTYTYSAVPKCFVPLAQQALDESGILQIRNQPNLMLTGSGVLIGIVDTGIDYTNDAFRYEDGSSRIVALWDQSVEQGTPPQGYLYGQEYTKEMLDEALAQENPFALVPENDPVGHGTALAALAAGSQRLPQMPAGAAPYADLAVVKLKEAKPYLREFYFIADGVNAYQENDIMLGVDYLNRLAAARNQPLVLLIGLGNNDGPHSGDTYLSDFLDDIGQRRRRVVVTAAGNEANARHHYYGKLFEEDEQEVVEINVERDMRGFYAELWSGEPELYEIAVISPSGERVSRIALERQGRRTYAFVLEGTRLIAEYRIVDVRSANQLIFLRFERPTKGIWKMIVYPKQYVYGTFHIWLPISEFLEAPVYFLSSSPDITLTVPGTARIPLTVGGYNDRSGAIYLNSGRGYTTEDTIKPELCAPAVGLEYRNETYTGTSYAAALTAGAAAMFQEWAVVRGNMPIANTVDVKGEFIRAAAQSAGQLYPNREWGYGRLDLAQVFLNLAGLQTE